jgi:hypothetical protein
MGMPGGLIIRQLGRGQRKASRAGPHSRAPLLLAFPPARGWTRHASLNSTGGARDKPEVTPRRAGLGV